MIVYRSPRRQVQTGELLREAAFDSIEGRRRFLIHWGEIEAALADEAFPERDGWTPDVQYWRRVSVLAAGVFLGGDPAPLRAALQSGIPDRTLSVSVPEGYAYYGLFPETYAEAARSFFAARQPQGVAVLGIRSIGTSLSAVVAAALEQCGCEVESITVRPHGHPFDRQVEIDESLAGWVRARAGHYFAIVDEGPGLSGSSFASVARLLPSFGLVDNRIVLFPSWMSAGQFVSSSAAERWGRHEKFVGDFHMRPGIDLSAGAWRALFFKGEANYPEVQEQHEARKFLCGFKENATLKKFSGFGAYGEEKHRMQQSLAEARFCPAALGFSDGWLETAFLPGQPLDASSTGAELLDHIARYLGFRAREFPADPTPTSELLRMMEFNTGVSMSPVDPERPCHADARMLPHEWLATAEGYRKADAVDHGNNHFYPGPVDIAWDLAGAITEFGLDTAGRDYLLDRYAHASGDTGARSRLPFYAAAYKAFRFGYTTMNGMKSAARYRPSVELSPSR